MHYDGTSDEPACSDGLVLIPDAALRPQRGRAPKAPFRPWFADQGTNWARSPRKSGTGAARSAAAGQALAVTAGSPGEPGPATATTRTTAGPPVVPRPARPPAASAGR
jgi:hypothetical protein